MHKKCMWRHCTSFPGQYLYEQYIYVSQVALLAKLFEIEIELYIEFRQSNLLFHLISNVGVFFTNLFQQFYRTIKSSEFIQVWSRNSSSDSNLETTSVLLSVFKAKKVEKAQRSSISAYEYEYEHGINVLWLRTYKQNRNI